MSKIRSISELEDKISQEYAWRRKEITNLKQVSLSAKGYIKNSLFRSSITILYAHWEGFVKNSSIAYLKYINFQGFKYEDLTPHYKALAILDKFQGQYPKTYQGFRMIFDGSIDFDEMKCSINTDKFIDTQSNLKSDVLKEITLKLGIDYRKFELKEKFIDEKFIAVRNAICHGEYREIDCDEFILIFDEVVILINSFKNELNNLIVENKHLR